MPSPSAEAIRSTTKAILARPEFQPEADPLEMLRKLLSGLDGLGAGLPAWVGWVCLGLATALIIYLLLRLLPGPSSASGARRKRPAVLVEVLEGTAATPEEALRRARASGSPREALWIAHRLLLFALDEKDVLEFTGHKTNGDYRRECPDHQLLRELSDDYDRVIYAHREIDSTRVAHHLDAVEKLL